MSEVAAAVGPSVVTISVDIEAGVTGEAVGTGLVVSADGEILTNAHVVADATEIRVRLAGDTEPTEAELIALDVGNDLALLRINGSNLPVAPFAPAGDVAPRRRGRRHRVRPRPGRRPVGDARHRVGA